MEKSEFYRNARHDLTGPLQGVVVLEATTTWAGPMAGCLLADFGADVIKVEHPAGEIGRRLRPILPDSSLSLPHETVNRNKRSMSLNLSTSSGRDVFLDLARRADIVVENFRPGTMAEWGVGYEHVRAVKPDIVYVSISGFGQFGRLSHRVGYDPVAQHYSGFTSINGDPNGGPMKAAMFLGDDISGIHAALGALAALRHRDRTRRRPARGRCTGRYAAVPERLEHRRGAHSTFQRHGPVTNSPCVRQRTCTSASTATFSPVC